MLTDETKSAILELQSRYPERRSALIPALHLAQNEVGYLPADVQSEVAALFALDPNEVASLVTFYDMFFDKPVGTHIIHVCKNLSCMLRGSDQLLGKLCQRLQLEPGQTSADGAYTLLTCECLAACDKAPALLVDEKLVGPVTDAVLDDLLKRG